MTNPNIDTAQDFMDCVSGDHGAWWKNRADEFAEDHCNIGDIQVWALWDLIRSTETPTKEGNPV